MKKADNLKKMMKDKKIIISGKNGEEMFDFYKETYDMVDNDDE